MCLLKNHTCFVWKWCFFCSKKLVSKPKMNLILLHENVRTKPVIIVVYVLNMWTLRWVLRCDYIHGYSSSTGKQKVRKVKLAWLARPFNDSWLVSSGLWESEAAADWLRLEHISYRFPENCIFLDSCLRDSHTTAASSGQPAMATFAQSWKSSQDLQQTQA